MSLPIKLKLPEHFLEAETRCGYDIPTRLKKIWAVELDLLSEFDRVCKKHNIRYFVFAGTLLGAVRHNGFIPWDDDIDVAMARNEYEKLCAIASKEFKHPYFFQTALNDQKYFFGFGRLRNSLTTGIVAGNYSPDYNNGIYIDVFVLDGISAGKIADFMQTSLLKIAVKCCTTYNRGERKNNSILEILSRIIRPIIRLFPFKFWFYIYTQIISVFTKKANELCLMTHFGFGRRYRMLRGEIGDIGFLKFENITVPVPKNYDQILARIYGDYMKYPDPKERGKWHEGSIKFDPDMPYKDYFNALMK